MRFTQQNGGFSAIPPRSGAGRTKGAHQQE